MIKFKEDKRMMIKLENVFKGFEITVTVSTKNIDYSHLVEDVCSQIDAIEYIGERVNKARILFTLVRYQDQLFYLTCQSGCGSWHVLQFTVFSEQLEDTEPFENYYYYVDYCNPEIDDETVFFWFFKENELTEAKKLQEKLGKDLAILDTI